MSPVKKASTKTSRAKKTTPKKVAKKAAKKVTKKTIKKVAQKKAVRKKTPTPPKVKTLRPKKKATIKDDFKKGEKKALFFPQSIALALIAVPKLPVDVDALAVGLARYGGMSFVIIGAFFTIWNANVFNLQTDMTAMLIEGSQTLTDPTTTATDPAIMDTTTTDTASTDSRTIDPITTDTATIDSATTDTRTTDPATTDSTTNTTINTNDTTNTSSVAASDPEPAAAFVVDQAEPLSDAVIVRVLVSDATNVRVYAKNVDTGNVERVGDATKRSDLEWSVSWNTVTVADGSYELSAEIRNTIGTYTEVDSVKYVVVNASAGTNTNDTTNNANTGSQEVSSVAITFEVRSDKVLIRLVPDVQPAAMVVKAVHRDTGLRRIVDQAEKRSDGSWRAVFETAGILPGNYSIYAVTAKDGVEFISDMTNLTVSESMTEPTFIIGDTSSLSDTTNTTDTTNTNTSDVSLGDLNLSVTPPASLFLKDTLSGTERVEVETTGAKSVSLYARSNSSGVTKFIGSATKHSELLWRYEWNTATMPNGQYTVSARITYEDTRDIVSRTNISINNSASNTTTNTQTSAPTYTVTNYESLSTQTAEQYEEIETLRYSAAPAVVTTEVQDDDEYIEVSIQNSVVYTPEDVPLSNSETEDKPEVKTAVTGILEKSQEVIDTQMQAITLAIRSGDTEQIAAAKQQLDELKSLLAEQAGDTEDRELIQDRIARQLTKQTLQAEKAEKYVTTRSKEAAEKDTDEDGISDFDEATLYGTDPLSADTDEDGFVDSVEILGGYNPNDPSPASAVTYESPKVAGVKRSDVLRVAAVEPVTFVENDTKPQAVISGKALPNSFVTLYVFSTPVVVTVRANSDGNWSYLFNKEIDNGEHEVYVGVTDNAGRLVAKSEGLRFIKTAEAFSPAGDADVPVAASTDREAFMQSDGMLLASSLSVVTIGVLLIFLGYHLRHRPKRIPHMSQYDPVV